MSKSKKTSERETVRSIIEQTVERTRISCANGAKDAYKATEKRLYAYTILKCKITDLKEKIEEVQAYGAPTRSKSVVRFSKTGMRLTPEEIAEALVQDMTADVAGNEAEIETIDKALTIIADDPYADIIALKYFESKSKDEIADALHCDPTTVWRNGSRLVNRLAVFLYGVSAIG